MLKVLLTILILLILSVSAFSSSDKISPSVQSLIDKSDEGEKLSLWLYLDSSSVDFNSLALSERSIRRRSKVDPGNFLITDSDYNFKKSIIEELSKHGEIRHSIRWMRAVSISTSKMNVYKIAEHISVTKIEPLRSLKRISDEQVVTFDKKNVDEKSAAFDYGISEFQTEFVNAAKLHQAGLTGKGVMIAMFDTGFRTDLPALDSADILAGYDFINNDTTVGSPDCPTGTERNIQTFHGTATLGVIASNLPGVIIGLAPGATFVLAKTEITCDNTEIKIEEDNWIAAAQWADSIGADIISSSLGYYEFTDGGSYTQDDMDGNTTLITQAADFAASKNILIVNSAGNERGNNWGTIIAPSDGDSVIATGAVTADSSLAGFSSPGFSSDPRIKPDITTLGSGVRTISHDSLYLSINGTSFSCPLVAGSAALALEHDPTMTAEELRNLIQMSGDRVDNPDKDFGYGLFDAVKTADIIKFDPPFEYVLSNYPQTITVSTSGRSDSIVMIDAISLPNWLTLIDNANGSADIEINQTLSQAAIATFRLTADVGYFVDTTQFTFTVRELRSDAVSFGPNPFSDSVNIYINLTDENLTALTLFNSAGEIVWEKVNDFTQIADVIIEQWNGRNLNGERAADGVYILIVSTDRRKFQVKLLKVDT